MSKMIYHCFFEQSGTFKNEFKKLGFEAYDYDILNNYGETDYVIDLYNEIDKAYEGKPSVFDKCGGGDDISVLPVHTIWRSMRNVIPGDTMAIKK